VHICRARFLAKLVTNSLLVQGTGAMSSETASARARKAGNPNKDPDVLAEKKAAKAERDALRKRADQIKAASWKYGLGAGGLIIGGMCLYALVTISRATIVTVLLDDASQLKEARPRSLRARPAPAPRPRAHARLPRAAPPPTTPRGSRRRSWPGRRGRPTRRVAVLADAGPTCGNARSCRRAWPVPGC
jgi:hypothetical protein